MNSLKLFCWLVMVIGCTWHVWAGVGVAEDVLVEVSHALQDERDKQIERAWDPSRPRFPLWPTLAPIDPPIWLTGPPSASPTVTPTTTPSDPPTEEPSINPTVPPSDPRTEPPSAGPSQSPTEVPFSLDPILFISPRPTFPCDFDEPTAAPMGPSSKPTPSPTCSCHRPTRKPRTRKPTAPPTDPSTMAPTEPPTCPAKPTVAPTLHPTCPPIPIQSFSFSISSSVVTSSSVFVSSVQFSSSETSSGTVFSSTVGTPTAVPTDPPAAAPFFNQPTRTISPFASSAAPNSISGLMSVSALSSITYSSLDPSSSVFSSFVSSIISSSSSTALPPSESPTQTPSFPSAPVFNQPTRTLSPTTATPTWPPVSPPTVSPTDPPSLVPVWLPPPVWSTRKHLQLKS